MGSRWTRTESCIEVQVETPIQLQAIPENLDDVNAMISLEMDFSEIVFVEKIIRYHQPFAVVAQFQVVWAGIEAEVDDARLNRMFRIAYVQHADLASLERPEYQSITRLGHGEQLDHAALDRRFHVRHDVFAIEDRLRRASARVHQVHEPVEHARSKGTRIRIVRDELDVHCSDVFRQRDRAH